LQGKTVNLYSDLLIHHMGPGLADGITQGAATGDMFRTAPLWGTGQRIFFLHDGRTKDLLVAIQAHSSSGWDDTIISLISGSSYPSSEANAVVQAFNALNTSDRQSILDFLRSL
jgi:CxxC motif-containing protein (DUF1111 family)